MSVRRGVNRSKSPDALKAIRSSESVASEITAPPIIGRHSDKRAVLRHAREELPPESIVVVEKLMNVCSIFHILFYSVHRSPLNFLLGF